MNKSLPLQLLASLCACVSLAMILLPLSLTDSTDTPPAKPLTLRQINLAPPPPPPPAPPETSADSAQSQMTLAVKGDGPNMVILDIDSDVSLMRPRRPEVTLQTPEWQPLAIDWQAYDLNALDALPTLVHSIKPHFPRSLTARGISQAHVQLDIFINEQGRITLINILKNPYPELKHALYQFVQGSRFSPPIKDGEPVRARFVLPLTIKP